MEEADGNFVLITVLPVGLRDGESRLRATLVEVWWNIHFNTELFREYLGAGWVRIATTD